jgi:hypothetical protein
MSNAARKLNDRAPRYILNPHEKKMVRVAPKNRRKHQIYELEIVDMSETGMSFIVNWNYLPKIGEILKVEFPVPGERRQGGRNKNQKVAWFAEVVRLEGPEERPQNMQHFSGIKVAVRFVDLPEGHLHVLKGGLDRKLQAVQIKVHWDQVQKLWSKSRYFVFEFAKLLFIVGMAAAFFYFVTRKLGDYDPNRPVNWGERFFERVIPK